MLKKIALFFDRPYIDAHFCFREMVIHFLDSGWQVDLYMPFSLTHPLPSLRHEHLSVNLYQRSRYKLLKLLRQLSCWGSSHKYQAIIATPQWALYWAARVGKLFNIPIICLSDEVYTHQKVQWSIAQKNLSEADAVKWKHREAWANQQCLFTIALSKERFKLTKKENCLPDDHPCIVTPNAPAKQSSIESSFYRETLNISENQSILLHSGSGAWSLIDSVLAQASEWSQSIHVVLQGRYRGTLSGKQQAENISISPWVLPAEMMHYATSSADIGLMLYNRNDPEESRNGGTAGKLGLYLSCGLPLICCNIESLRWVDKEGCGCWIEDVTAIPAAVEKIMNNYDEYSQNSQRIYLERFEYSKHFVELVNLVDSLSINELRQHSLNAT
ncbi:MAG: hypothetical protein AB8B99_12565 [Phormidesmis sp.]